MSQPIPPDELELLIAGYVLNDLSPEEAAAIAPYLADGAVTAAIEDCQIAWEAAYLPAAVQPAAHVRSAVMAGFDASLAAPARSTPRWLTELRALPRWAKATGLAAAAMIVALGTSTLWLWRSLQLQLAQAPRPSMEMVLRPTAGTLPTAEVAIAVDPQRMTGTLKVNQLPPLAPGKVYALWTVLDSDAPFTTDHKNAILTHVFVLNGPGDRVQELVLPKAFQDLNCVKAVAISIEDARAPQRHQSSPILIQRL